MDKADIEIHSDELLSIRESCHKPDEELYGIQKDSVVMNPDWGHPNMPKAFLHFTSGLTNRLMAHSQWLLDTAGALQSTERSATECDEQIADSLRQTLSE